MLHLSTLLLFSAAILFALWIIADAMWMAVARFRRVSVSPPLRRSRARRRVVVSGGRAQAQIAKAA